MVEIFTRTHHAQITWEECVVGYSTYTFMADGCYIEIGWVINIKDGQFTEIIASEEPFQRLLNAYVDEIFPEIEKQYNRMRNAFKEEN